MKSWTETKDTAGAYLDTLQSERWFDADYDEVAGFIYDASGELPYQSSLTHSDTINMQVEYQGREGGWTRVKHMLDQITETNREWYYLNGYGNYEDVTKDNLISELEQLLVAIAEDEADNE